MLRWGILGTSFISHTLADAIGKDDGSSLVAIAGRRPEAVAEFQQTYQIERGYLTYDELIADDEVDVVYIALPNQLHHIWTTRAAEAGKHILCEKSLSLTMEWSKNMLDVVEQSGIFFMEGLMYLTHPLIAKAVDLLKSDAIGRVRSISGRYCAPISQFVNPDGGGAIYNLGCYPASLLHLVMQTTHPRGSFPSYEASGFGHISEQDGNVCETTLTLKFANGVLAQLHCAETYGMSAEFSIVGDLGRLRFVTNPWLPTASENRIELTTFADEQVEQIEVSADDDAFLYEVRTVRDCIENGRQAAARPAPRWPDSLEIMALLTTWEVAAVPKTGGK